MKRLAVFFPLLLIWATAVYGEPVMVVKSWAKIHQGPAAHTKPIALAFGNETLEVTERKGEWLRVRTGKGQVGWIAAANVLGGSKRRKLLHDEAKALAHATALQRLGYRDRAREKLLEIVLRYPDTLEFYEAVRHLLFYYPVGKLSKPKGEKLSRAERDAANELADAVLLRRGRELVAGGHFLEGVSLFEAARLRDKSNRRALEAIHEALTRFMTSADAVTHKPELGLAVIAFRDYFPHLPLPSEIRVSLRDSTPGQ